MADLVRLLTEALEGGLLALPTRGKRPCVKSFSLPKGAKRTSPDSGRVVVRYSGEKHPYTAEELIAHIEDRPDNGVSLWPDTMQAVVVDFDEGQGHALWADLIGGYRTHTVSSGGRGLHVWWGRPDGYQVRSGKYRLVLPTLDMQGSMKHVEADLIIRGSGVTVKTRDDLESVLAPCWPGLGAMTDDEIPPMDADTLDTLIAMQTDGAISEALVAISKAPPQNRHNVLISEAGKCFQGAFRRMGPDSLLGRAIVEVFDTWFPGKGAEASRVVGDICAGRIEEYEEAARHFAGKRTGAVEPSGPKPSFTPDRDGLQGILEAEGLKVGWHVRGRPRLMVDHGKGAGWEQLTDTSLDIMRGDWRAKYAVEKKDAQSPWWIETEKFDKDLSSLAARVRIDPFHDYLDSVPTMPYNILSMYGMPGLLWEWEQSTELVGWTFQALMVAMVARHRWPGCKFDLVPVIRGDQGVGKSTFLRALFPPEAHYDELLGKCNFRLLDERGGGARLIENTMGKVVCEIPELKAVGNLEEVKDFITSSHDEMRMAYGRHTERMPRSSVFVATTNHYEPLRADPSGNRRFVPVSITGLTGGVPRERAYQHIMGVMDQVRDEWWGLAKGLVYTCYTAEECGSRFLTPGEEMTKRLVDNVGEFERTSYLGDEVKTMIDGLTLADSMGGTYRDREYVVGFLSLPAILSHLGMDPEGKRVSNEDAGKVKTAMEAVGWKSARKSVYDAMGKSRKVLCYWPAHIDLPMRPTEDEDALKRWLLNAKDGEPVSNAQLEAITAEISRGVQEEDPLDADIPFAQEG